MVSASVGEPVVQEAPPSPPQVLPTPEIPHPVERTASTACQAKPNFRSKSFNVCPSDLTTFRSIETQTDDRPTTTTAACQTDDDPLSSTVPDLTPIANSTPVKTPAHAANKSSDQSSDYHPETSLDTTATSNQSYELPAVRGRNKSRSKTRSRRSVAVKKATATLLKRPTTLPKRRVLPNTPSKSEPSRPSTPAEFASENKYIVSEHKLFQLFDVCPDCYERCRVCVDQRVSQGHGTMVRIRQTCRACPHDSTWDSQPIVKKNPIGNLLLTGAIVASGSQAGQVLRMFDIMKIKAMSMRTFFRQQSSYLFPTIVNTWKREQSVLVKELEKVEGGIHVAGDCRNDSPGHCAKYGVYTLIEQKSKKVLDIQVVQSNEAGSSNNCELVGFQRAVDFLTRTNDVTLATIVTDRHLSIAKYIREHIIPFNPQCAHMKHYNDVWHVAKGLRKNLCKKLAKMQETQEWIPSAVNHMYFVASRAPVNGGQVHGETFTREDYIEHMWNSLDNHVHNQHEHHSMVYPNCHHVPIIAEPGRTKGWLQRDTDESDAFRAVITAPRLLKDLKKLSPDFQTSSLEAYHSLLLHFTPKHTHFSWLGMIARTYVAALHHNENANRLQAVTKDGEPRYTIVYPKTKKDGGHTVRAVKTPCTHKYAHDLMVSLVEGVADSPAALRHSIHEVRADQPDTLSSTSQHPNKAVAISEHRTRFGVD